MEINQRVSIVVITRNRERELCHTLEALCNLPERARVIVVDNGSTDDTAAAARRFPRVEVVEAGQNLGAAARQVGLDAAVTPYVAFADDDVRWQAGSLALGCDLLERFPHVAVITAKVLLYDTDGIDETCLEMARSPLPTDGGSPGPCVLGFLAGASIVRRTALLPAMRSFPERLLIGGEEEWISAHLAANGSRMCYVEELVARHYPSLVRNAEQRRRRQIRNAIWFAWLRRPIRSALRRTLRIVIAARQDGIGVWPCFAALVLLPKMIGERRVVPSDVEAMFRILEQAEQ
jgi:N-acetylglucosaminyl-diphospho-decaprenol L-rhamnosyltransferase